MLSAGLESDLSGKMEDGYINMMQKTMVKSPLDPELVEDISQFAKRYDALDSEIGNEKWNIAGRVNEMEDEHKGVFDTLDDYRAECSRVANLQSKRHLFAESGETLRRWCDVRKTYENFEHAELFLSELSFDHLYRARVIYNSGAVKSPLLPLAEASKRGWSAEDMEYHYKKNPPSIAASFLNTLKTFIEKKLVKLDLPRDRRERVEGLIAELRKELSNG